MNQAVMGQYADGKMLAAVEDGVGLITFNQPEKRNAMSINMWDGLGAILDAWAEDPAVRVVVLTGAGDKAFVSGADISQFEKNRSNADAQKEYDRLTSAGRAKLGAFPKPVIARIHGFCLGGGLGIAMQADIRIASESSAFGIPAARLGIVYGFPTIRQLISLVGQARARALLFSARRIDAAEALRIGLVNEVVPDAELVTTVDKLARTIAGNAPLSVMFTKAVIDRGMDLPLAEGMAAEGDVSFMLYFTKDRQEGLSAFREKRTPGFRGE